MGSAIICPGAPGGSSVCHTTLSIPSVASTASRTSTAASALAVISVSLPSPAAKFSTRISCPITESTSSALTNDSEVATPSAFSVVLKPARNNKTRAVAIQVTRGRRPTLLAIFAHRPDILMSSCPNRGVRGQNAQLPEGKRSRVKGPLPLTRAMPKTIQPTIVTAAKSPPVARNGVSGTSTRKPMARPMIVGTKKARIGSTKLGIARRAGRKVSITITAATMPIAATGPVDLLEFNSLSSKHMSPMDVVAPEATMGSTVPRRARRIAVVCSRCRCSSSR